MTVLLDTHAWIWWVVEDRRLSKRASTAIDRAQRRNDLSLSVISIWEVAKKVQKRQLRLDRPLDDWIDSALAVEGLQVVELTRDILVESCRLPGAFHGDPADQMIVATARHRGAVVVSADSRMLEYDYVKTIW